MKPRLEIAVITRTHCSEVNKLIAKMKHSFLLGTFTRQQTHIGFSSLCWRTSLREMSTFVTSFSAFLPADMTFWSYVKEHLNRHELQRFYSLRQISSELGRGRAWLRCALNEHSLERYLHTLLADRPRLGLVGEVTYAPPPQ